jgi:hypothetical protein
MDTEITQALSLSLDLLFREWRCILQRHFRLSDLALGPGDSTG